MKNADKPIQPLYEKPITTDGGEKRFIQGTGAFVGLTKREHFAGLAMQAMTRDISRPNTSCSHAVAELSVCFADALLAALEEL